MAEPVVHFELVGRNGTSLQGFISYSEVFGCDADASHLKDELPDDVAFYVSVRGVSPRAAVTERASRGKTAALAAPSR